MNPLLLLIACLALISTHSCQQTFESFKALQNKQYKSELETLLRKEVFLKNSFKVDVFNKLLAPIAGYELGINHLSDLTEEEMAVRLGFKIPEGMELQNSQEGEEYLRKLLAKVRDEDVPAEVDWRKVPGRVTRVKDQGQCGSCWAFSATGALEGQMEVQNKTLKLLSEQNLVDCSTKDAGCNGGIMLNAWLDIKSEGGIEDETSYPYKAKVGVCKFDKTKAVFDDKSGVWLNSGSESLLKKIVAVYGPVSVAIDANHESFQLYKSGVYFEKSCGHRQKDLNHGVLVVGYGTDRGTKTDYWIVKNSWGYGWGDGGYIRMARNMDNHCGIATLAMIPTF